MRYTASRGGHDATGLLPKMNRKPSACPWRAARRAIFSSQHALSRDRAMRGLAASAPRGRLACMLAQREPWVSRLCLRLTVKEGAGDAGLQEQHLDVATILMAGRSATENGRCWASALSRERRNVQRWQFNSDPSIGPARDQYEVSSLPEHGF